MVKLLFGFFVGLVTGAVYIVAEPSSIFVSVAQIVRYVIFKH